MRILLSHRLAALLISALCAGLFLRGALTPGRVLVPYAPELFAVQRVEAQAEGRFPEELEGNLGSGDKYHQTLALDRIYGDRLAEGSFPRWTRAIGGGIHLTPHLLQSYHPLAWTNAAVPAVDAYAWWFVALSAVFGLGCFGFLRRIGVPPAAAMVGVVAACLGFWTQARIQHLMHLTSAVPAFFVLSLIHDLFRGPKEPGASLHRAALLAAAVGLSWLGAFHQHSVHLTWLAAVWALALAWGGRGQGSLRALLWTGAAFAVGGLAAAPQALTSWLAASISSRGFETTATLAARSLEVDHLLHLLWPDLLHWPRDAILPVGDGAFGARPSLAALIALGNQGSGANWTETAFGVGATGSALAAIGIGTATRRWRWGLLAVIAFSLGVACAAFPFLQVARALPLFTAADVKRTIFLTALALPVAAALGAARLGRAPLSPRAALAWAGFGLCSAALGVAVALLGERSFLYAVAWLYAEGDDAAASLALSQADALWLPGEPGINKARLAQTFFCSGTALVVFAALARFGGARGGLARTAGIGTLLATELLWVGRGAFVHVERERVVEPPALIAPVLEATAAARAAGEPAPRMITLARARFESPLEYLPPNLPAFYGVEDCATYNPLPPRRMEAFFDAVEPADDHDPPRRPPFARKGNGIGFLRLPESLDHPMLDVFGVRFVLSDRAIGRPGIVATDSPRIARPFRIFERTSMLPRATWVTEARVVDGPAAAAAAIGDPARDPLTCVLEAPEGVAPPPDLPPSEPDDTQVRIERLEPERVVVAVDARREGYLRLADPYDPGWTASLDGAPVPLYIADLHLRAVRVPEGQHTVEFRFDGPRVVWPVRLGMLGWLLVLGAWITARFGLRRSRKEPA